jgi:hypothetical protein
LYSDDSQPNIKFFPFSQLHKPSPASNRFSKQQHFTSFLLYSPQPFIIAEILILFNFLFRLDLLALCNLLFPLFIKRFSLDKLLAASAAQKTHQN